MGQGLQRVAKHCGGLVVIAKGHRVEYVADGKIASSRRTSTKTPVAKLDGDEASFRCPKCERKTTWPGYSADAFRAPLELCCAHCNEETFFDHVDVPGKQVSVSISLT